MLQQWLFGERDTFKTKTYEVKKINKNRAEFQLASYVAIDLEPEDSEWGICHGLRSV